MNAMLGLGPNSIDIQHRTAAPPKPGTIDVIGSSNRDSRRPMQMDFHDHDHQDYKDLYVV